MAISFTRPDPASPASVSSAQFPTSRRGYDQAEVRDFLRMVAAEQARLQERERFLERELRASQQAGAAGPLTIDDETATRLLGEEAARLLQTARESAAQIRARAEEGSARILRDATDEAQRIREEAEIESARRRQDASADAEAELQMAKQQGRDMVNEARSYRERVLSELARRRELARQQIEQLIHGRDRLLQAFERSRIAAVEVMAELTPLGEPSEYVNLQPTTGPVPVMVPNNKVAAPYSVDEVPTKAVDASGDEADAEAGSVAAATVQPVAELHAPVGLSLPAPLTEFDDFIDVDATAALPAILRPETDVTDVTDVSIDDEIASAAAVSATSTVSEVVDDGGGDQMETEAEADEIDAEADEIEADVDEHDDTVVSLPPPAPVDSSDDDNDGEYAPVVSLFAGEIDHVSVAEPALNGGSVDDLFARLRAAHSDAIAAQTSTSTSTGDLVILSDELQPESAAPVADGSPTPALNIDEVVVPLIVSASRKLKRVLADEQNEVLDALRRKEPVRAIDTLLPWETEQATRYSVAVEADLAAAALAGAQGDENGRNPAIIRPAVDAVTNEIVAPLRERLTRCIDKAGGNNSDLANQVRSLYREWKTHRIDEHVEDIVRLAFDRGALTVPPR